MKIKRDNGGKELTPDGSISVSRVATITDTPALFPQSLTSPCPRMLTILQFTLLPIRAEAFALTGELGGEVCAL